MTDTRRYAIAFVLSFLAFSIFFAAVAHSAPTVPDPIDRPVESVDALREIHRYGGLYVMLAVAIAAFSRAVVRLLRPDPGASLTGWRSRTIATLTAVSMVAAGVADLLLGSLSGAGFVVLAAGAIGLLMDPRDRKAAPAAAAVLLVLLTSCAQVRPRAGAAVQAGLDCQGRNVAAVVHEAGALARAAVLAAISGDGKPDTAALRAAARGLQSDGLRCAFAAAVAALATPPAADPGAPQTLGLEVDGPALRAAARAVAAEEWGVRGAIAVDGGVL